MLKPARVHQDASPLGLVLLQQPALRIMDQQPVLEVQGPNTRIEVAAGCCVCLSEKAETGEHPAYGVELRATGSLILLCQIPFHLFVIS